VGGVPKPGGSSSQHGSALAYAPGGVCRAHPNGLVAQRRRLACVAILALLATSLLAAPQASAARTEFYGIAQGAPIDRRDLETMAAARVQTDRFLLFWGAVEPIHGSFRWEATDRLVGSLASHGVRAVPAFWGNPDWVYGASARPPIDSAFAQQAWQGFLKAAVTRYGPGGSYWTNVFSQQFPNSAPLPVQSWQVWNEPNLKKYFVPYPSPGQYARLLRLSVGAIKSRDPKARVVLAGMPGWGDFTAWDFLDSLYSVPGIKAYFDAAALHPYARDLDHFRLSIERFRAVMTHHNDGATPLWLTELAWGSAPPDSFGINKGPTGQAEMLSDSYQTILSHRGAWNVQRLFWYRMRDPVNPVATCSFCASAGLLEPDRTPKPALSAFEGFSAETTAPRASITAGPGDGGLTRDPTPTFTLSSNEAGTTFTCRVDSGSFAACGSPFTTANLADGSHLLEVKAIDAAGNESTIAARSFTVDTEDPFNVSITAGPASGSVINDPTPSFAFSTEPPGAELSCRLDDDAFAACASPFTTSALFDGDHTFTVRAADGAGESAVASREFTVDTTAPAVRIEGPRRIETASKTASATFTLKVSERALLRCALDLKPVTSCSSPYRTPKLRQGTGILEVRATDRAGNVGTERKRFEIVRNLGGARPPGAPGAPSHPRCRGVAATLIGSGGANRLRGTDGPDVIVGFGGDDKISGRGGDDLICARHGDDAATGGPGNDRIFGGPGADHIRGRAGRDGIWGRSGFDYCGGVSPSRGFGCERFPP
jgi:Bacterial Ig-like domain/RTX calcium-binding nonapeptide repeat (4 copies)/Glycosyl hydrolase catalytic core